jgi:hypothetical protein
MKITKSKHTNYKTDESNLWKRFHSSATLLWRNTETPRLFPSLPPHFSCSQFSTSSRHPFFSTLPLSPLYPTSTYTSHSFSLSIYLAPTISLMYFIFTFVKFSKMPFLSPNLPHALLLLPCIFSLFPLFFSPLPIPLCHTWNVILDVSFKILLSYYPTLFS